MSELQKERAAAACRARATHGLTKTPEYRAWVAMRSRCSDKNVKSYAGYGGRGIGVCWHWKHRFENFYTDMGPRPSPQHTLEREDNERDYGPDNCVWALMVNQQNNKRNTFFVIYRGAKMGLGLALRLSGSALQHATVARRMRIDGWDLERALFTPIIHQRDRRKP